MRTLFVILGLCLLAANAAVIEKQEPINYEGLVNDLVNDMTNVAVHTAQALEHQLEEIIVDPLQQIDEALEGIESRKEEDEECVNAEEPAITAVVQEMHGEMGVCGVTAAKESASIMADVNAATQQIVFDGISVAKTYQKCKKTKNKILRTTCYTNLTIKATLYMKNTRKSIKTIKHSTSVRGPAVFTEADACTHVASEKALHELEQVHGSIDACVARRNN